jgi:hypothetical protein
LIESIFFEFLGDFIEHFKRMCEVDVEVMTFRFDLTVEGGYSVEESNDRLEVGLH